MTGVYPLRIPTPAGRKFLKRLALWGALAPYGPGQWPMVNRLHAQGFVTPAGGCSVRITPTGRAAIGLRP